MFRYLALDGLLEDGFREWFRRLTFSLAVWRVTKSGWKLVKD